MMIKLIVVVAALAIPALAQPGSGTPPLPDKPGIKTEDANIVVNVPAGKHVVVRTETGDVNVDELPEQIDSSVSSLSEQLESQVSGLVSMIQAGDDSISTSVDQQASQTQSTIAAAVSGVQSSVQSTIADVQSTATSNTQAVNSLSGRINRVDAAVLCASAGQKYNNATGQCYSTKLPKPDYVSSWVSVRAQQGTLGYAEILHNLNEDPERVQVLVRKENRNDAGDGNNRVYFEAMGAGTCDDDSYGCNDYGGTVFAYNNDTVRIWVPDRNNAQTYGTAINIHDGWGANQRNIVASQVQVMVRAWRKYRPSHTPDFDRTMRFSSGRTYQQWTYRAANPNNRIPDRVYATVEAVDGNNRGYKFVARGASLNDNDRNKDYGGLVFGYNENVVRLWAPHSSYGGIIFINDGWGGERNSQKSKNGDVRVRIWYEDDEYHPDFTSEPVRMCSNCLRGTNRNCDYSNPFSYGLSYKEIQHNLISFPSRVRVTSEVGSGNNNGYHFESISFGGDDEMNQRTGLISAYTDQDVILWAPTRNNGQFAGRIAGVIDGWGAGTANFAVDCVNVTVSAWI